MKFLSSLLGILFLLAPPAARAELRQCGDIFRDPRHGLFTKIGAVDEAQRQLNNQFRKFSDMARTISTDQLAPGNCSVWLSLPADAQRTLEQLKAASRDALQDAAMASHRACREEIETDLPDYENQVRNVESGIAQGREHGICRR